MAKLNLTLSTKIEAQKRIQSAQDFQITTRYWKLYLFKLNYGTVCWARQGRNCTKTFVMRVSLTCSRHYLEKRFERRISHTVTVCARKDKEWWSVCIHRNVERERVILSNSCCSLLQVRNKQSKTLIPSIIISRKCRCISALEKVYISDSHLCDL